MEGHPLALPSRLILARLGVRVRLQEGTWTRHVADAQRVVQRARRDMDRDWGREDRLMSVPPPTEPDVRVSRIRLSS